MRNYSNTEIINGFKGNDTEFLEELYRTYYPSILKFVKNNNGKDEDARDVFQEALLIIYQKVRKNSFTLDTTFLTYIYAISKNLWMKELRKKKLSNSVIKELDEVEDIDYYISFENEYKLNVEYFIFRSHFNKLSKNCKEILRMFLSKVSYEKIACILNYKNEIVVRKRKYRCKNILVERIKNDVRYKEIKKQ